MNSAQQNLTYVQKVSAGMVFINPYNLTYTSMYSTDTTSNLFRADIMVYLNIIGAIYVLIHSIFLRRMLVSMSGELDKAEVSP